MDFSGFANDRSEVGKFAFLFNDKKSQSLFQNRCQQRRPQRQFLYLPLKLRKVAMMRTLVTMIATPMMKMMPACVRVSRLESGCWLSVRIISQPPLPPPAAPRDAAARPPPPAHLLGPPVTGADTSSCNKRKTLVDTMYPLSRPWKQLAAPVWQTDRGDRNLHSSTRLASTDCRKARMCRTCHSGHSHEITNVAVF